MATLYIREGSTSCGTILANFNTETKMIREGSTSTGRIIAHIDGDIIREGAVHDVQDSVRVILHQIGLTGDSIREGNGLLNKICGHLSYESGTLLIREGTTSFGKILCNITQY